MLEIDELGLTSSDRKVLEVIISKFGGGPVGLGTIAAATSEEEATIEAVRKVSNAVVSIIVSKEVPLLRRGTQGVPGLPQDLFGPMSPFNFFFSPLNDIPQDEGQGQNSRRKQEVGGGSGFIIAEDGLIMTNKHVVADETADYTVVTNDGKEFSATVVARDPASDIAFVRIKAEKLPTVALGNSDKVRIGQTVIAIGFALGEYRNSVTKGVISGIGRRVVAGNGFGVSEVIEEAFQTDAAINKGNSGGPLINLSGEVIGINTAVNFSGQLLGFSIPINQAKNTLEDVKKNGRIIRPWLGVRYLVLNPVIDKQNNVSVDYGALIVRGEEREDIAVIPGSPADKAGLRENDIILSLNKTKISEEAPLAQQIAKHRVGDDITLTVLSKGKEKKVKLRLEEFPAGKE